MFFEQDINLLGSWIFGVWLRGQFKIFREICSRKKDLCVGSQNQYSFTEKARNAREIERKEGEIEMRTFLVFFLTFGLSAVVGYFIGDYIPSPLKVAASDLGIDQRDFEELVDIQTRHKALLKAIETKCGSNGSCQKQFLADLKYR